MSDRQFLESHDESRCATNTDGKNFGKRSFLFVDARLIKGAQNVVARTILEVGQPFVSNIAKSFDIPRQGAKRVYRQFLESHNESRCITNFDGKNFGKRGFAFVDVRLIRDAKCVVRTRRGQSFVAIS